MPRTKKPAGAVADRRNGRKYELAPAAGAAAAAPALPDPDEYCLEAQAAWTAYWADPVRQAITAVDHALVLRWVDALNRYLILVTEADREPLVPGSTGQPVANPKYAIADRALRVVVACERQLGVGPRHRADLGLALLTEQRTLDAVNERYRDRLAGPAREDDEDDDPRLG